VSAIIYGVLAAGGFIAVLRLARGERVLPLRRGLRVPHTAAEVALPAYADFVAAPWGLDDAESGEYRYCPEEMRTRYSAVRADGSARCWTCSAVTPAGDHQ